MNYGIENVTRVSLGLALDAAVLQQRAIASNVANAGVDGYVPLRVEFSEHLDIARREIQNSGTTSISTLQGIQPKLVSHSFVSGQIPKVRLDVEMANLSENAVYYQALLKGINRHFSVLTSAVNEGKK